MDAEDKIRMMAWLSVAGVILTFVIVIIANVFFSEKHLNYYYLASNDAGQLCIYSDIENAKDNYFEIHNCTYEDAVKLVERLNLTLIK